MAEDKAQEKVFVIPSEPLFAMIGDLDGFRPVPDTLVGAALSACRSKKVRCLTREQAESDPGYQQIIPYVLLRENTRHGRFLYRYNRGTVGGEERLRDKWSIGLGGHMGAMPVTAPGDPASMLKWIRKEAAREVKEEIDIPTMTGMPVAGDYSRSIEPLHLKVLGLVRQPHTEVGSVHLGVVLAYDILPYHVLPKSETNGGDMVHASDVHSSLLEDYEDWSRFVIEHEAGTLLYSK